MHHNATSSRSPFEPTPDSSASSQTAARLRQGDLSDMVAGAATGGVFSRAAAVTRMRTTCNRAPLSVLKILNVYGLKASEAAVRHVWTCTPRPAVAGFSGHAGRSRLRSTAPRNLFCTSGQAPTQVPSSSSDNSNVAHTTTQANGTDEPASAHGFDKDFKRFPTCLCGADFGTNDRLMKHIKYQAQREAKLAAKREAHHAIDPVAAAAGIAKCLCGTICSSTFNLKRHFKTAARARARGPKGEYHKPHGIETLGGIACLCGEQFATRTDLRVHIQNAIFTKHGLDTTGHGIDVNFSSLSTCLCGSEFKSFDELAYHIRRAQHRADEVKVHHAVDEDAAKQDIWKCLCGTIYSSPGSRDHHIKLKDRRANTITAELESGVEHGVKSRGKVRCICGSEFGNHRHLNNHLRIAPHRDWKLANLRKAAHTIDTLWEDGIQVNKCTCGKTFSISANLYRHIQIEADRDDRPVTRRDLMEDDTEPSDIDPTTEVGLYPCRLCDRHRGLFSFTTPNQLREHWRKFHRMDRNGAQDCFRAFHPDEDGL